MRSAAERLHEGKYFLVKIKKASKLEAHAIVCYCDKCCTDGKSKKDICIKAAPKD